MRDPVKVLYYPDFHVDYITLLKAILLFDELHFMDRPSMMFGSGQSQFGTIGAASPLRQFEKSFREEGVPFYVHDAPMGPVQGEWYDQIKRDVDDVEFLRRFQSGLTTSQIFRGLQIAPGNYGEFGNQDDVAARMMAVDLGSDLAGYGAPMELFQETGIRHFDLSSKVGCAKHLIAEAVTCSAKLNFALGIGAREGFFPLADAKPYGDLLGAKYARAVKALEPIGNKVHITDLSFAIFDELISTDCLRKLSMIDAVRYRKESAGAREEFLGHLAEIQAKQSAIGADGDYAGAIGTLIATEVRPAVAAFRNRLQTINEALVGSLAKGVIGAAGGSSALTLFGDLSWPKIIALAGAGAAYVAKDLVDGILAERAARRECSLSYILSLED